MSKKQKGVTIVGVLIGIMILSIALAAQVRLLGNTIRREADLRNLITATNLAREGIEIAFSWRVSEGWNNLKLMKESNQKYCADIGEVGLVPVSDGCDQKLLNVVAYPNAPLDMKSFLYSAATDGIFSVISFSRTIEIEGCDADTAYDDQCLILKSTVGWDADGSLEANKEIVITKKIYNWYVP